MSFRAAAFLFAASLSMREDKNKENRQKFRKMAAQTLQDSYKLPPTSKSAGQEAAGHCVCQRGYELPVVKHGAWRRHRRQLQEPGSNSSSSYAPSKPAAPKHWSKPSPWL